MSTENQLKLEFGATMEINLKNEFVLSELEYFREKFYELLQPSDEFVRQTSIGYDYKPDIIRYQCSEERLEEIIKEDGDRPFPYDVNASPLRAFTYDGVKKKEWEKLDHKIRFQLVKQLGVSSTALSNRYPRGGLTGWHTNSNSAGYQFLFTWSETGEGAFRYKDVETGKIITLQDKPGWQARQYHFSDQPSELLWHCCYTDCERITIALKIDHTEHAITKEFRDDFIFELETQ